MEPKEDILNPIPNKVHCFEGNLLLVRGCLYGEETIRMFSNIERCGHGLEDVSRFPNHANIYQLWDHFHVNASNVSPYFEGESA